MSRSATTAIGAGSHKSLTTSMHIELTLVSPDWNSNILSRLSHRLMWFVKEIEPPTLIRYLINEEYLPHHDDYPPIYFYCTDISRRNHLHTAGNRSHTAIIYLNDDFEGGTTFFPAIDKSIKPEIGKLVTWKNIDSKGARIDEGLHCGKPVLRGEKYILGIHKRERPLYL